MLVFDDNCMTCLFDMNYRTAGNSATPHKLFVLDVCQEFNFYIS
jgi:hypothetical protein